MKNKKSQAILGYVLVVAIVIGAIVAMFIYVRRGLQGRYKEAADVFGQEEQYEPGVTEEKTESDESTTIFDDL